ncbi:MAG: hypothetical protein JWN34_975 [Bryobacterales bacterium]|nr:hypothetical protein [Bryobacterales bacterium]
MTRHLQQGFALLLSCSLLLVGPGTRFGYAAATNNSPPAPQATQDSPEQLEQLVAPIALYPDSLIAQILPAATYPEQVVDAEKWMTQNGNLTGDNLAKAVDSQPWDVSVKALTEFPAVLGNMNQNLAWTSELGDAYLNQQPELSQAIQTMRVRAKQAGNLNTTAQQKVSAKGPTIVIQPAENNLVYVPQYDPWLVYGEPLAMFPGWYPWPGLFFDGPGVEFGVAFGVGLFGGFGWGWHNWGYDWHHDGRVVYNHNSYLSHSTTIVNRNSFHSARGNFNGESGHQAFRAAAGSPDRAGMHSGAFSGFNQGGIARGNASRGQASFGGFHGGVGFHGGGGGFHGGGGRR